MEVIRLGKDDRDKYLEEKRKLKELQSRKQKKRNERKKPESSRKEKLGKQ